MKKGALLLTLLLMGLSLSAREVLNINRNWSFFSATEGSSDGAQIVNLPHTWNKDALSGKKDYFRGVGNYIKEIMIPTAWENKKVYIRFHGSNAVTDLMVNGRHVGDHRGGYTSFTFDITRFLEFGKQNKIWVIVNNAPMQDLLPTAGDMNIYGGLYRDVELIVTEPTHLALEDYSSEGVYLTQRNVNREVAEIDARIKIEGRKEHNLIVSLALSTPRGDTLSVQDSKFRVPATGQGELTIPIVIEQPILWHGTENPYLYNVTVKLTEDEHCYDSLTLPLGVRYFSVDPTQGFLLNGKPYPIQGAIYHEDRASVGPALTSYQVKEDLDLMVEMGVNTIRAAAYPHNREFYEECDKRGILVWSDLPLIGPAYMTDRGFVNTTAFRESGEHQLLEMIYQHYNHPSIVMWGIFSDLSTRGDDPTSYVEILNTIAKKSDPKRLTVASSNQDGRINFITDLILWNHVFGWQEGLPEDINLWMNVLKSDWSQLKSAISYGAGASIYHQDDSLYRPNYLGNWHPERWQTHLHEEYLASAKAAPQLWGTFVANMFDYGAAGRTWGEGTGIDDRGMVTFDRKYTKDAFYLYKANWNRNDPFVYIAEKRWQRRSSKRQTLKVYSNLPEVELFVNGISQGTQTPTNGILLWRDVELNDGNNAIEARSANQVDYAEIEVADNASHHGIN